MKLNIFLTIISIAFAGLGAFGFYVVNASSPNSVLIAAGSCLSMFITLGGLFALSSTDRGTVLNVRVVSALFFILLLIEHIVFSFVSVILMPYVVITGVLLLLYVLICYAIIQTRKNSN
ncbi:MAG: hypothetical protein LBC80_02710 [Treponema sp.]|jgi:hypothetical protein|nr:hypothetical protein [Treponema sp.]